MKYSAQACDADYVFLPRLAFRLLTYAQSTSSRSLPQRKTFPLPCNAQSLFTTIRHHLSQALTHIISLGCLVVIIGCCITWSPLLANLRQVISVKSGYCMRPVMITPLKSCGSVIAGAFLHGTRFPKRILGGSPVLQRVDSKYTMTY